MLIRPESTWDRTTSQGRDQLTAIIKKVYFFYFLIFAMGFFRSGCVNDGRFHARLLFLGVNQLPIERFAYVIIELFSLLLVIN